MSEQEKTSKDSADALAALAAGQELTEDEQAKVAEDLADAPVSFSGDAPDASASQPVEPFLMSGTTTAPRRAVNMNVIAARKSGNEFKKFMMPLLLAVGVLLLVMGAIVIAMMPPVNPSREEFLCQPYAKWVVISAFPLSAVMLLGAFMFWKDIQSKK
jgi:hypothetical protein